MKAKKFKKLVYEIMNKDPLRVETLGSTEGLTDSQTLMKLNYALVELVGNRTAKVTASPVEAEKTGLNLPELQNLAEDLSTAPYYKVRASDFLDEAHTIGLKVLYRSRYIGEIAFVPESDPCQWAYTLYGRGLKPRPWRFTNAGWQAAVVDLISQHKMYLASRPK